MRHPMHSIRLFLDLKALRPRTVGLGHGNSKPCAIPPGLVPYDVWPVYPCLSSTYRGSARAEDCASCSKAGTHLCVLSGLPRRRSLLAHQLHMQVSGWQGLQHGAADTIGAVCMGYGPPVRQPAQHSRATNIAKQMHANVHTVHQTFARQCGVHTVRAAFLKGSWRLQ